MSGIFRKRLAEKDKYKPYCCEFTVQNTRIKERKDVVQQRLTSMESYYQPCLSSPSTVQQCNEINNAWPMYAWIKMLYPNVHAQKPQLVILLTSTSCRVPCRRTPLLLLCSRSWASQSRQAPWGNLYAWPAAQSALPTCYM